VGADAVILFFLSGADIVVAALRSDGSIAFACPICEWTGRLKAGVFTFSPFGSLTFAVPVRCRNLLCGWGVRVRGGIGEDLEKSTDFGLPAVAAAPSQKGVPMFIRRQWTRGGKRRAAQ
jgi:hypothetical protein